MIRDEKIQKPFLAEFANPGSRPQAAPNPSAVGTGANGEKSLMRTLERCAEAGDLTQWKKLIQDLPSEMDLPTRVRVKQYELTLLFRASKRARQQEIFTKKKATDAQVADQNERARQLFNSAQKFNELATYLTQQLRAKTA